MNYGLDLEREAKEQTSEDWIFGASLLENECEFGVPMDKREAYLPTGELQRGAEDFMDCVTRGYMNILETKFTFAYQNGLLTLSNKKWLEEMGYVQEGVITFSDRFVAVLSNTTRNGNGMKSPVHTAHEFGLIPKSLLPARSDMTWDEYHNREESEKHIELGKQFLERFQINYERVYTEDMENALTLDMLNLAGYAWQKPINGEYPRTDKNANHAFMGFALPKTYIFDNYIDKHDGDWIKKLAVDYNLHGTAYRVYVTQLKKKEKDIIYLIKLL